MTCESSSRISNAGIIAAAMVVGIHVCNCRDVGSALWWWEELTHYGVFLIAVPFFFICSGYFLARHYVGCEGAALGEIWWREVRKRMRSLFVPYVMWSAIAAVVPYGLMLGANLLHGRELVANMPLLGWRDGVYIFGLHPFAWPSLVPLWYVRVLLIFVVLSPIAYLAIKRWGGANLLTYLRSGLWGDPVRRINGCLGDFLSKDVFVNRAVLFLRRHVVANSRRSADARSQGGSFTAKSVLAFDVGPCACYAECSLALFGWSPHADSPSSFRLASSTRILELPTDKAIPCVADIISIPDLSDTSYCYALALACCVSFLAHSLGDWLWRGATFDVDLTARLSSNGVASLWRSLI